MNELKFKKNEQDEIKKTYNDSTILTSNIRQRNAQRFEKLIWLMCMRMRMRMRMRLRMLMKNGRDSHAQSDTNGMRTGNDFGRKQTKGPGTIHHYFKTGTFQSIRKGQDEEPKKHD